MRVPADPGRSREQARQAADRAQREGCARVGLDLMNAYNHAQKDPSQMAVMGHEIGSASKLVTAGYEFCVERDGVTYVVQVGRDLE